MSNEKNMDDVDKQALKTAFDEYHKTKGKPAEVKLPEDKGTEYYNEMRKNLEKETDPDLIVGFETIQLPSNGIFYENGLSSVDVEYLTSEDEDIMTTPSLIEKGVVMDMLLKRKIRDKSINPDDLLSGDRSAIVLYLRASSYGHEYTVTVSDPRNSNTFEETVDLRKFKYKEVTEKPDSLGEFTVHIPKRDKDVKFRLLTSGEEKFIENQAETMQHAYSMDYSRVASMKLKAAVTQIGESRDKDYIHKFLDAAPALDTYTIRKKIIDVTPEINMEYEFTAPDGYKFKSFLVPGIDFFFPGS